MERVAQSRHGRLSRVTEAVREQLRGWVSEQPDRTLAELGEQLHAGGTELSRSRISQVLHQLGLRLKKSRSMPASATRKPIAGGAKSTLPTSPRSRQRS
jgi:transposase